MKTLFFLIILSLLTLPACSTTQRQNLTAERRLETNYCEEIAKGAEKGKLLCTFVCPMNYRPEKFTDAGSVICAKEYGNEYQGVTIY